MSTKDYRNAEKISSILPVVLSAVDLLHRGARDQGFFVMDHRYGSLACCEKPSHDGVTSRDFDRRR